MDQATRNALRKWRDGKGFTNIEAGRIFGVSGVQWYRYENGTREVASDRVIKVEKITGVSRHRLRPDVFGRKEK